MHSTSKRICGWVAIALLLGTATTASAERTERLTVAGHRLKIAGVVLLSIAGTVSLAAFGAGGASYYYNTDNHWQNGHQDTGPATANMAGCMAAAAGLLAGIGTPLVIAGDNQRAPAQAATLKFGVGGVSGTF